uniref:CARD domain-containing protein n=1 Tax=Gadus morhua TaxID=8049 RepID=A0A8C5B1U0_GADMO
MAAARNIDDYRDHLLQRDAQFLCGHQRMDTALLDRLILNDHEAQRFRNPAAATRGRLSGLLAHLQQEGDEACLGFYQALQLHAEDLYCTLPSRVSLRGPWFYLSCFCLTVGLTALYYYGGESYTPIERWLCVEPALFAQYN